MYQFFSVCYWWYCLSLQKNINFSSFGKKDLLGIINDLQTVELNPTVAWIEVEHTVVHIR